MLIASGDLWAGAEVMVYQLSKGLSENPNIEVMVLLLNYGMLAEKLKTNQIKVEIIDESKYSFWQIVKIANRLVDNFSPDVLHSHRYKENLISWIVSFGRRRMKLIATQHGMIETTGSIKNIISRFRSLLSYYLISCCFEHTVFVSSEMQKSLVNKFGFNERRVSVIHNGINYPDIILSRSGTRMIVGSAGRLFPVKDFSLFVKIANLIVKQNDAIDFVLAGSGPQRFILEEKVKKLGMQDRFKFIGHQDDMDSFFKKLDVYINTSTHEGIPMSVLEAMSYGLPVIAPKVGGFPEIIENGISGFLVDSREPIEYSSKIIKLMDKNFQNIIGFNARKVVVDRFSRQTMTKQYVKLYNGLA